MTKLQISKSQIGKSQICKLGSVAACLLIACGLITSSLSAAPVLAQKGPPDARFGAVEAFRDPGQVRCSKKDWNKQKTFWTGSKGLRKRTRLESIWLKWQTC
jgi:hypothetical protein